MLILCIIMHICSVYSTVCTVHSVHKHIHSSNTYLAHAHAHTQTITNSYVSFICVSVWVFIMILEYLHIYYRVWYSISVYLRIGVFVCGLRFLCELIVHQPPQANLHWILDSLQIKIKSICMCNTMIYFNRLIHIVIIQLLH